ncbi:deaminase, partial [Alphaproteobacteria bacterium]|nr:deaminase [Alphaproteobacteria bacterium]
MLSNKSHLRFLNSVNNLSLRNLGLTGKNPSVACLIVDYSKSTNGKVLSYGLTSMNGSPHAEVNALNKIKKNQITNKTFMYVSLEPCYKLDKCCAKRIVNIGIHNVIISSKDPNPIIKNKGIEFLKKNKINVFLAKKKFDQFKNINKYFFNFHEKNRPHIT